MLFGTAVVLDVPRGRHLVCVHLLSERLVVSQRLVEFGQRLVQPIFQDSNLFRGRRIPRWSMVAGQEGEYAFYSYRSRVVTIFYYPSIPHEGRESDGRGNPEYSARGVFRGELKVNGSQGGARYRTERRGRRRQCTTIALKNAEDVAWPWFELGL